MKKSIAALMAGAALFLLASCNEKIEKGEFTVEKGKYKVGVSVDYPPFEYYAQDGKTPLGFDISLSKEIASRIGLEVEFVDTDWDGLLAGLDAGRFDVVTSGMTITPERSAKYNFTNAYVGNGQALLIANNSTLSIAKPEDLTGLKVGYQTQTTSDIFMKKLAAEKGLEYLPSEYDKAFNAFDDLKFGRIDAVMTDYLVAADYFSKKGNEFKIVWTGTSDEYMGIALPKSNDVLLQKVNAALADMVADGTMKKLYEEDFGMDLSDSVK
ncbi:MAG: transporter substrate-binding domain-containing protein [Treponema sp.]|nr:transporter substrate-binding domain-containing protein [Treponema sp.]